MEVLRRKFLGDEEGNGEEIEKDGRCEQFFLLVIDLQSMGILSKEIPICFAELAYEISSYMTAWWQRRTSRLSFTDDRCVLRRKDSVHHLLQFLFEESSIVKEDPLILSSIFQHPTIYAHNLFAVISFCLKNFAPGEGIFCCNLRLTFPSTRSTRFSSQNVVSLPRAS